MTNDHNARRVARDEILRRFYHLSWQDQYKTYEAIQGYFQDSGPGSEAIRELRERSECVEAVQQVAAHLQLPAGNAPGVQEYEKGRKELGLHISSAAIIRRWVVWREVCKAVRGEEVSQSARQRAHVRAALGQKRNGEEWLAGLREWLMKDSPGLTSKDYDEWAGERNEQKPTLPPVASAQGVRAALGLPWSTIVKVAQGKLSLASAQANYLQQLKQENGEFIGLNAVALIYGASSSQAHHIVTRDTFPPSPFTIHESRVWYLEDVEAHHLGETLPKRETGELQDHIFTSERIRQWYNLTEGQLKYYIRHNLRRVPFPEGIVVGRYYWLRCLVEDWDKEHPEHAPKRLAEPDDRKH